MKARDLMIPLQEHVAPETMLREAVRLLLNARSGDVEAWDKGLPVLDGTGKLVGIMTMHDVLKAVYPPYLSMMNLGEFTWDGMVEDLALKAGDKPVAAIMTTSVITAHEHDTLMDCIDKMLRKRIKRMPVVDAENRVVGMLYERHIFQAVSRVMLKTEPPGERS